METFHEAIVTEKAATFQMFDEAAVTEKATRKLHSALRPQLQNRKCIQTFSTEKRPHYPRCAGGSER
jgi:hypothetical protein